MSFCPLHNHSEYSQLDGLSTTREIADRCIELEYDAIGLSDHGTVAGHLDFARTMKKEGIKPIFAAELYHGVLHKSEAKRKRDQAHLLAGALTDEGLKNLWRLVDASATEENFYYVPRVTWDLLEKYSEGVFITSACMLGLVSKGIQDNDMECLNRYIDIFGDKFFIELHTYPSEEQEQLNLELVQIADERGLPMTIATDSHYAHPDQYEIHDSYMALQVRDNIYADPAKRKLWHPKALYIKSEEEIRNDLSYLPSDVIDEAIANNAGIAEQSTADLPIIKRHLPMFIPRDSAEWLDDEDQDKSAVTLFIDLVERGLVNRYGENPDQEVWDRATQEMTVFLDAGLEHYFLQTWDFCQYCNSAKITRGPGRGSAGGAIVAYALGITDIDPIKYKLKFERFYNPGRAEGLPDIDNDFPRSRRDEIKKYMAKRWGSKNVRSIGTITRMKPKSACDETWYPCGIEFKEKEELKRILEEVPDIEIHGPETIGWDEEIDPGKTIYVMDAIGDKVEAWIKKSPSRQPTRQRWIDILRVVCSRVARYGVHPSGVVVSDHPLDEELPCRWSTEQKVPVTMFGMRDIEARQFVKQDILGLRNLDTLEEWERLTDQKVEWSGLEDKDSPEEMWKLLDHGLSMGVFQIEDGYARRLCKEIQPRSIEDLGAIVALNRPGPIRAGVPDSFITRRFGLEDVTYDHPLLEDILEPTYGHLVYQEQVIEFMRAIGYSDSDADAVRSILGKKKPEAMKDLGNGWGEWRGKGYLDMAHAAGIDKETAEVIWSKLEGFASYSFNKSHAYQYAILGFRTLYAKYTRTPEFLIALINTNPESAGKYVAEGHRMGVNVIAPEIDRSEVDTTVQDGDIVFGFSNIKGIGKGTAEFIVSLRDMYDITTPEKLFEAVQAEQKVWESSEKKTKRSPRQRFRNSYDVLYNTGCWDGFEERSISSKERQEFEKELLKVVLTDTSVEIFNNNQDLLGDCNQYDDLETMAHLKLPGVITQIKETRTKRDRKTMGVITVEYHGDEAEFVVFPQQWQTHKFLWKERTTGIFELKKTDRGLNFASGQKLT